MFSGICVAQSVGFCVVFCWPLFLSLFSKASSYLSFLDFRLLITPWYLQTVFHKSIIQNTILLLLGYCLQTKSTFSFIITGSIGISGRLKNILIKCNRLWRWRISLICIWLIKSTSTLYFTIDVVLYHRRCTLPFWYKAWQNEVNFTSNISIPEMYCLHVISGFLLSLVYYFIINGSLNSYWLIPVSVIGFISSELVLL